MSDFWWDKEAVILQTFFTKKKGAKKEDKQLGKRLNYIPYDVKCRVMELYGARQNLLHLIKFMQWLMIRKAETYTPERLK